VPSLDTSGHIVAIVPVAAAKKLRAFAKIAQTRRRRPADLLRNEPRALALVVRGTMLRFIVAESPTACKEASMARTNLRIYRGPADDAAPSCSASTTGKATMTTSVGDILPLLAEAVASDRTWLADFADDPITISSDLYEVLLAYQYYRHPAA
jgi:hypothetical protein